MDKPTQKQSRALVSQWMLSLSRLRIYSLKKYLNMKIYTKAIQFKADGKLHDRIDQKLSKIERLFDRIIDASVQLKLENSGQVKDKILEVKLNVPGSTLIASATDKTFESALDTVVDSLKKQLIKYKAKLQNGS